MTRSTKTERYVALLEAAVANARAMLDEDLDPTDAAERLADSLDDLDAYCSTCDDAGVVEQVRGAYSSTCDPADVDEVPCDCEAARVITAQREDQRRRERADEDTIRHSRGFR